MKEATGELNATVVVVVTIGILSTFFFTIIWPRLKGNLHANTKCSDAICEPCPSGYKCETVKCKFKDKELVCPYKG